MYALIKYKDLNTECLLAVEDLCDTIMLNFLYRFNTKELNGLSDWQEEIYDNYTDDSCIAELDMYERVRLVAGWGKDYDMGQINCSTNVLEIEINNLAVYIVRQMAEELANNILNELSEFMDKHDLDTEHIVESNSHGWARHFAESDIGDSKGSIYHYRNLEGEKIHIDVYEYRLMDKRLCCFEKQIKPEDVTEEENYFDAT